MTKNVHTEIIKQSRLRNRFLKSKSMTERKNYNIQCYFLKETFKNY